MPVEMKCSAAAAANSHSRAEGSRNGFIAISNTKTSRRQKTLTVDGIRLCTQNKHELSSRGAILSRIQVLSSTAPSAASKKRTTMRGWTEGTSI